MDSSKEFKKEYMIPVFNTFDGANKIYLFSKGVARYYKYNNLQIANDQYHDGKVDVSDIYFLGSIDQPVYNAYRQFYGRGNTKRNSSALIGGSIDNNKDEISIKKNKINNTQKDEGFDNNEPDALPSDNNINNISNNNESINIDDPYAELNKLLQNDKLGVNTSSTTTNNIRTVNRSKSNKKQVTVATSKQLKKETKNDNNNSNNNKSKKSKSDIETTTKTSSIKTPTIKNKKK